MSTETLGVETAVRDLDRARRVAMVAADLAALQALFAEELLWVHGTARVDTGSELLQAIGSGTTRYVSIDVTDERYRRFGECVLLTGLQTLTVEIEGDVRQAVSRYTIAWHRSSTGWQVVNWQSTPVRSPSTGATS